MKSIRVLFERKVKENPNLSSFICFGRAIRGKRHSSTVIRKNFNLLVDPDDYDPKDKKALYVHFNMLTNLPEGARNSTKKLLKPSQKRKDGECVE